MKRRRCRACGRLFEPCRKVKKHEYCSERSCQNERKRLWQKNKLAEDPTYKANQRDAQKRWRANHPEYWREYRKRHSEYERRNRELQRGRNRLKRCVSKPIAKMDASEATNAVISGHYQLVPLDGDMIAKMDAINVRIEVIPRC